MNKLPRHVGIIMDGNGRWATSKGLRRSEGHKAGYKTLKKLATFVLEKNIEILSVFAFGIDNFKRDKEEVDFLMNLFVDKFKSETKFFNSINVRVIFSGLRDNLRKDVIDSMEYLSEQTKNNTKGILNICLNYSGTAEIVDTTKRLIEKVNSKELDINKLDEEVFRKNLFQDLPPIDLLIRTSGEQRLSNFMLYQVAYSEFYFSTVHFPDFDELEFTKALEDFMNRDRKFGAVPKK